MVPYANAFCSVSATVVAPPSPTVKVDMVKASFCAAGASEDASGQPSGVLYSTQNGVEEIAVVHGQYAFTAPGDPNHAMTGPWSDDLAPTPLAPGAWVLWSFGGYVFYTTPAGGVWYREIGTTGKLLPLYRDTQSPGSSGVASYQSDSAWLDLLPLDDPADVLTFTDAGGTPITSGYGTGEWAGKPEAKTDNSWVQVQIALAVAKDVTGVDSMGIVLQDKTGTNDGYTSTPANNTVVLKDSTGTHVSATLPIVVTGRVDVNGGTYYGWVDLSGVPENIKSDLGTVIVKVGTRPRLGDMVFRFQHIYFGGVRYKDSDWGPDANAATTDAVEYAHNLTEGATVGPAASLTASSAVHLGTRLHSGAPYMGSALVVTVPQGDAPFTAAAKINLYRKVGDNYHRIAQGDNDENLVFEDRLQDAEIAADPVTYPIVALSFDEPEASFSGQVSGIIGGCHYRGSNIYVADDGKVYGSRTGTFDEVLWNDVVLTNDVGSEDLGPARTTTVSDDLRTPALAAVPGDSLYLLTYKEVYAMTGGETFATASFPKRIDGARGVVGPKAATSYGDACLYGATDGLWLVRKAADESSSGDAVVEFTKENRGAWLTLLGAASSSLVVRHHLGEIWCFCQDRYLHLTRQGLTIPGQWVDGRSVVDATSDPARGLILQLSDGSVAVIGDYLTDGGTDLAGTTGSVPEWLYETGLELAPHTPIRFVVNLLVGTGGEVAVTLETEKPGTGATVVDSVPGRRVKSAAIDRSKGIGALTRYRLTGRAGDRVATVEVTTEPRQASRTLNQEID